MTKVKVGSDDYTDDLLFIWPATIVHVIDEESPFYNMDATTLLNDKCVKREGPFTLRVLTVIAGCMYMA